MFKSQHGASTGERALFAMRSHAAALTREYQISLRTSPMVPGLHNQRGGKLGFDRNWETLGNFGKLWETLGNFGKLWFSLVFLAFPKFPKVSQRFPPAPFAAKSWKCRVGSDQLAWCRSLARYRSTPHPILGYERLFDRSPRQAQR